MITYEATIRASDFSDAEYDATIEISGNEIEIRAYFDDLHRCVLTLEQFDAIAERVSRYRRMLEL